MLNIVDFSVYKSKSWPCCMRQKWKYALSILEAYTTSCVRAYNLAYTKWKYWLAVRQYVRTVLMGWIKAAVGPSVAHACSKLHTAWLEFSTDPVDLASRCKYSILPNHHHCLALQHACGGRLTLQCPISLLPCAFNHIGMETNNPGWLLSQNKRVQIQHHTSSLSLTFSTLLSNLPTLAILWGMDDSPDLRQVATCWQLCF